MAVRPDYTSGSLTLTSGSVNFTTSGSALQVASVQAGDEIITPSGDVLIIASITGQNSGTLFLPCPASAAGAGLALRIRFQPDGSRYQGAARDLIEKLASGNLEALAGLVSAANKGIMFTGAGTADTFDLTANSRELLGAANDAAFYAALGEIPNLQLPARLRVNPPNFVTDCNAITESGWYRYDNNTLNTPFPNTGIIFHLAFSNNQARQWAGSHSAPANWSSRINVQGAWVTWFRDYTAANIIGTVSQSSGVPTGGIFQRGSNTNGEFVRSADGTMECNVSDLSLSYLNGSTLQASWTYPSGFSSPPAVLCTGNYFAGQSSDLGSFRSKGPIVLTKNATAASIRLYKEESATDSFASGDVATVNVTAKGRWF